MSPARTSRCQRLTAERRPRFTELAERMSCERSNAGYVIDRMEQQGLVRREPHPTDRRAKILCLTNDGRGCRRNVLDALSRDAPIGALSEDEKEALATLLRKATALPGHPVETMNPASQTWSTRSRCPNCGSSTRASMIAFTSAPATGSNGVRGCGIDCCAEADGFRRIEDHRLVGYCHAFLVATAKYVTTGA